ncbi:MAG: rhodanese-like domain-containing protein [Acidimicrobiales bacterium]
MKRITLILLAVSTLMAAACGSDGTAADSDTNESAADSSEVTDTEATSTEASSETDADTATSAGVRLVSASDGASILAEPPADLVILDVRTPEEFADARIEGATMLDFYREDFLNQLADLDPNVPYLLYCRSGNRSGQTSAAMKDLGFVDVAEVDGGLLSWAEAQLPTVAG